MELTVYSRSNNHELWLKMREFIPAHIECIEVTGFDHWRQASDYLYHIVYDCKTKFCINIDIDAFVVDWVTIENLIREMIVNNSSHSGVRDDYNTISHRDGPDTSMNPHFNIFNSRLCKQILVNKPKDEIEFFHANGVYNSEPFHGMFTLLHTEGKPLYLKSKMHYDKCTNMIYGDSLVYEYPTNPKLKPSVPMLIHTWYSREYGIDPEQTERIDYFYEQAKRMSTLNK